MNQLTDTDILEIWDQQTRDPKNDIEHNLKLRLNEPKCCCPRCTICLRALCGSGPRKSRANH